MKKIKNKKTPPPFKNNKYYIGGNNKKTHEHNYYPNDTDDCTRNLGDENKNEEYEEYIETKPEENDSIKSKISEGITEKDVIISLLAKKKPIKVIKSIILSIDTYKQDMIAVGNLKKIQNQDK